MENYSLSDIKAVTDPNGGGFGDNGAFWLVLLFLFFGMSGNGFGRSDFGGAGATAAAQNEILLGQKFEGVSNKLNEIGNGICNSTYAITNAVTNEGRAMQTQLAECCCDTRLGIANLNAKIDQQTGQFTAMLKDMENQRLMQRVQSLELKDAMCGVVRYPQAMTYSTNCNPFCGNSCYGGYQQNI